MALALVLKILPVRGLSEIVSAVVQTIAVLMVYLLARFLPEDLLVHVDS